MRGGGLYAVFYSKNHWQPILFFSFNQNYLHTNPAWDSFRYHYSFFGIFGPPYIPREVKKGKICGLKQSKKFALISICNNIPYMYHLIIPKSNHIQKRFTSVYLNLLNYNSFHRKTFDLLSILLDNKRRKDRIEFPI